VQSAGFATNAYTVGSLFEPPALTRPLSVIEPGYGRASSRPRLWPERRFSERAASWFLKQRPRNRDLQHTTCEPNFRKSRMHVFQQRAGTPASSSSFPARSRRPCPPASPARTFGPVSRYRLPSCLNPPARPSFPGCTNDLPTARRFQRARTETPFHPFGVAALWTATLLG